MTVRLALAGTLLAGALARGARADERVASAPVGATADAMALAVEPAPAAPDAVDAWASTLGSPARHEALAGLPAPVRTMPVDHARRAVDALALAGGFEAAEALRAFLEHPSPAVRQEAAAAVARVGVRTAGAVAAVRRAAESDDCGIRVAVFDALGRVGDARDVPGLVAALQSPDARQRAAAQRALRLLADVRIEGAAPRWERWWRLASTSAPRRLHAALAALGDGTAANVEAARETVARYGWSDVDAVEEAARAWLRSGDARLRGEGLRAARALRLGGLADDVRSILRYTGDPTLVALAREAATAIGVRLDDRRAG